MESYFRHWEADIAHARERHDEGASVGMPKVAVGCNELEVVIRHYRLAHEQLAELRQVAQIAHRVIELTEPNHSVVERLEEVLCRS